MGKILLVAGVALILFGVKAMMDHRALIAAGVGVMLLYFREASLIERKIN